MVSASQYDTQDPEICALLVRIRQGDQRAFRLLYKLTSDLLFGVLMRFLRDRADAEEALQEVYVKIWKRAKLFEENWVNPRAWLIVIARNTAIDRIRARKAAPADVIDAEQELVTTDHAEHHLERSQSAHAIMGCFKELPKQKGDVVLMVYLSGYSYSDVAEKLDIPINTVKTWLRRSLLALRECVSLKLREGGHR